MNIYNKNFPVKKVTKRYKHLRSPYITLGLQTSIKERRRLQRLADKYPLTYGEHYKKYRNKLNKLLKEANQNYYKNQFKDSQGNIKETWGHINSLMGRKKKSGNNDIQMPVNSCEPLADYIKNYFIDIAQNSTHENSQNEDHKRYFNEPTNFSMHFNKVTETEVLNILKTLKKSASGSGPSHGSGGPWAQK